MANSNGLALDQGDSYALVYDPITGNPVIFWSPNGVDALPKLTKPIVLSKFHITRQKIRIEFSR